MAKYCDIKKFSSEYLHKVSTQFDNAIHEMEKDRFCVSDSSIPEKHGAIRRCGQVGCVYNNDTACECNDVELDATGQCMSVKGE